MSQIVDYKLADVGEGIAEAEVIEWLVAVGDLVKEDQPVIVVETDKSQIEIPAPVAGKVIELVCRCWRRTCRWSKPDEN